MNLRGILWGLSISLWGVATVGFWAWTTRYEFATDSSAEATSRSEWPLATRLVLGEHRPTLLFFVHPQCPCTRASVHELERTLTRMRQAGAEPVKLIVVASLPSNAPAEWRETSVLRRTSSLPGVETYWDVGGAESRRFGVTTSGAVKLYRADGRLLFSGGITPSRGHQGDSAGGDHLYALLTQASVVPAESTPVFGCRLYVESSPANIAVDAEGGSL
jgi:hypothetical protein